ncbi:tetraacyldisaccharide 4'-kinase, partial [Pseudomonas aeruginosa]
MSYSERLLAAWYQGHPALAQLRPLEALYRRVANGRRPDYQS